jgi:hypothetical protein
VHTANHLEINLACRARGQCFNNSPLEGGRVVVVVREERRAYFQMNQWNFSDAERGNSNQRYRVLNGLVTYGMAHSSDIIGWKTGGGGSI